MCQPATSVTCHCAICWMLNTGTPCFHNDWSNCYNGRQVTLHDTHAVSNKSTNRPAPIFKRQSRARLLEKSIPTWVVFSVQFPKGLERELLSPTDGSVSTLTIQIPQIAAPSPPEDGRFAPPCLLFEPNTAPSYKVHTGMSFYP